MDPRFERGRRMDRWNFSRLYGVISLLGATFAIVSSPGSEHDGIKQPAVNDTTAPVVEKQAIEAWERVFSKSKNATTMSATLFPSSRIHRKNNDENKPSHTNSQEAKSWGLTRILYAQIPLETTKPSRSIHSSSSGISKQQEQLPSGSTSRARSSWIDPSLLQFTAQTPTDLMDKVISSNARLLLIANWLLACTVLMHSAIAECFLGPNASSHETVGVYLIFRLLLIGVIVAQDHLDWLILLSWYTCLQFLRSLVSLSSNAIANARGSGQIPKSGVWKLLLTILVMDGIACATCIGLLHEVGPGVLLVLTCDCVLLAVDVLIYLMQCKTIINEFRHQENMAVLEQEQLMGYDRDLEIEQLERSRLHQGAFLDGGIFWFQFCFDLITILHYVHIWTLHKLQLNLINGVLALQLYSAFNAAKTKIAMKRKLNRISKEMDAEFKDASELDIKKAAASGDVCCICLSSMSWIGLHTHVKKLNCGHMYHTSCLRKVVERARSMDAARCPMCRNTIQTERQRPDQPENEPQHPPPPPGPMQPVPQQPHQLPVGDEQPLFRFTTAGLWPWLPAVSFEVVRRPDYDTVTAFRGLIGMTEAEEQMALQRLLDMFPQYDRNELLTAIRERGSDQAVAEAILVGALAPTVR